MSKHPGVFRKGPDRGWVYRWREWDPVAKREKQPSSEEYPSAREASIARGKDPRVSRAQSSSELRRARGGWMGIATAVTEWKDYRLARDKIGPYHAAEVERAVLRLARLREWTTLGDITVPALDAAQGDGDCSNHTLESLKSVLSHARRRLRQPIDLELFETEPLGGGERPKPVLYSQTELAGILAVADQIAESIGTLARYLAIYGVRPVDAVRLRVRDFDRSKRMLTLPPTKNGIGGPQPLAGDMVERLARLCRGRPSSAGLFPDFAGADWGPEDARRALRLSKWWPRRVTKHLPAGRQGIYLLKDYAISRMDHAGIKRIDRRLFTKHKDEDSYESYEATSIDRARELLGQMLPLPEPKAPPRKAKKLGNRLGNG